MNYQSNNKKSNDFVNNQTTMKPNDFNSDQTVFNETIFLRPFLMGREEINRIQ